MLHAWLAVGWGILGNWWRSTSRVAVAIWRRIRLWCQGLPPAIQGVIIVVITLLSVISTHRYISQWYQDLPEEVQAVIIGALLAGVFTLLAMFLRLEIPLSVQGITLGLIGSIFVLVLDLLVILGVGQPLPSEVVTLTATVMPTATATPTPKVGGPCTNLEVPAFLAAQRQVSGTMYLSAPVHLSPQVILSPEGCKTELAHRWFSDGKRMSEWDDFQTIPLNPQYLSAEQTLRVVIYMKPIGKLEEASIKIVVSK